MIDNQSNPPCAASLRLMDSNPCAMLCLSLDDCLETLINCVTVPYSDSYTKSLRVQATIILSLSWLLIIRIVAETIQVYKPLVYKLHLPILTHFWNGICSIKFQRVEK